MKKHLSVTQIDGLGCGVACIAFLVGKSYLDVLSFFENPTKAKNRGYTVKELSSVLTKILGKQYKTKYIGKIDRPKIPDNSIIYIKKCDSFPHGHYLVKTKGGYMDPFINLSKTKGDVSFALSGFRERLPGKIVYLIYNDS